MCYKRHGVHLGIVAVTFSFLSRGKKTGVGGLPDETKETGCSVRRGEEKRGSTAQVMQVTRAWMQQEMATP